MTLDRQEVDLFCSRVQVLVIENERLTREVASLKQQLEIARSTNTLDSATARAWVNAMAKANPTDWKKVTVGNGMWSDLQGYPTDEGLVALLLDLTALPGTDVGARLRWDAKNSVKHPERVGNYPPKFRNQYDAVTYLRDHGHDGVATTLHRLRKGLSSRSKAYLLITAVFLIYKGDAVKKLTDSPGEVLAAVIQRERQATWPHRKSMQDFMREHLRQYMPGFGGGPNESAFRTLGLTPGADRATIKKAYRDLAKQHHPDVPGGSAERFQEIQKAYELIAN